MILITILKLLSPLGLFIYIGKPSLYASDDPSNVPNLGLSMTPYLIVLFFMEEVIARIQGRTAYNFEDTVCAISSMTLYQVVSYLTRIVTKLPYLYMYTYFRLFTISPATILGTAALMMGNDFCYYWWHRFSHESHLMWAAHALHHTGEHQNMSTAFRLGIFQNWTTWVFFLPLALLGFNPAAFAVHNQLHTLYQFVLHTEGIGKAGWLEYVFITPAAHRTHHRAPGRCNYAGLFCFWDKMFGTYRDETARSDNYGLASPVNSFNAVYLNFAFFWREYHHYHQQQQQHGPPLEGRDMKEEQQGQEGEGDSLRSESKVSDSALPPPSFALARSLAALCRYFFCARRVAHPLQCRPSLCLAPVAMSSPFQRDPRRIKYGEGGQPAPLRLYVGLHTLWVAAAAVLASPPSPGVVPQLLKILFVFAHVYVLGALMDGTPKSHQLESLRVCVLVSALLGTTVYSTPLANDSASPISSSSALSGGGAREEWIAILSSGGQELCSAVLLGSLPSSSSFSSFSAGLAVGGAWAVAGAWMAVHAVTVGHRRDHRAAVGRGPVMTLPPGIEYADGGMPQSQLLSFTGGGKDVYTA